MNILVLITTDPRLSPRPAEAVRIAAGVAVWGKVRVSLWLDGPAALGLEELCDDLCDAEVLGRHLVILQHAGGRIVVPEDNDYLKQIDRARVSYETVEAGSLPGWVRQHHSVVRF
jgi:hypothetical protein